MTGQASPGPQRGPASVPQINAQVKQSRRESLACPTCGHLDPLVAMEADEHLAASEPVAEPVATARKPAGTCATGVVHNTLVRNYLTSRTDDEISLSNERNNTLHALAERDRQLADKQHEIEQWKNEAATQKGLADVARECCNHFRQDNERLKQQWLADDEELEKALAPALGCELTPSGHSNDERTGHSLALEAAEVIGRLKAERDEIRKRCDVLDSALAQMSASADGILANFKPDGSLAGNGEWRAKELFKRANEINDAFGRCIGQLNIITEDGNPETVCKGCGKPLEKANAWMDDGCPCNTPAGANAGNQLISEWRRELQQEASHALATTKQALEAAEQRAVELTRLLDTEKAQVDRQCMLKMRAICELVDFRANLATAERERDELRDREAVAKKHITEALGLCDATAQWSLIITTLRARLATAAEVKQGPCELGEGFWAVFMFVNGRWRVPEFAAEGYFIQSSQIAIRLPAKPE